jgi:hypothetical protein
MGSEKRRGWISGILGAVGGALLTLGVQSYLQNQDANRREHDSALDRLQSHQVALHSEAVRLGENVWHLKFTNSCKKTAYIAVRYEDLLGTWMTHGWLAAKPGETVTSESYTVDPDFYWFADVSGGKVIHDPANSTTRRQVSKEQFTHIDGDVLVGGAPYLVDFAKYHISSPRWTDSVVPISCSEK